jgi:hypothetical protein
MATSRCSLSAVLSFQMFPTARTILALTVILLAASSVAQQLPPTSQADSQASTPAPSEPQPSEPGEATVTIPAGTRLALVLTHPIDSKTTRRGDEIYAQTTAPVTVGNQAVMPAGTFVQGKVDKLARNGNRGEFLMQSISVIFPDGYVAEVRGPTNIESEEGTAWPYPSSGTIAGAIAAPIAGAGIGALIGNAAHTTQSSTLGGTTLTASSPKGIAIGSAVGLVAGAVISLTLLIHSHNFYVEVGSPMELTLPQPVTLAANQVTDAVRQAQSQPPPVTPIAARPTPSFATDHGTCYTPDTPGTPPTVIPGTPGVGDMPGTPDIVIPGTPAIPGTPYPCP